MASGALRANIIPGTSIIMNDTSSRRADDRNPSPPPGAAKTRADLFAFLNVHDIGTRTVDHAAVFTVAEGRDLKMALPGGHSKNLFLKDKAERLYLVSALAETQVDLVGLGKRLGSKGRLSFGKAELMTATLGVIPGAVTPFALLNESARALSAFVLDTAILAREPLWFHPLENTASTSVSAADFLRFLGALGVQPLIVDLAQPLGT